MRDTKWAGHLVAAAAAEDPEHRDHADPAFLGRDPLVLAQEARLHGDRPLGALGLQLLHLGGDAVARRLVLREVRRELGFEAGQDGPGVGVADCLSASTWSNSARIWSSSWSRVFANTTSSSSRLASSFGFEIRPP